MKTQTNPVEKEKVEIKPQLVGKVYFQKYKNKPVVNIRCGGCRKILAKYIVGPNEIHTYIPFICCGKVRFICKK